MRWGACPCMPCRASSRPRKAAFLATAPDLGAHSRAVLREYGYNDRDIDGMAASGAVIDGARMDRNDAGAQAAED